MGNANATRRGSIFSKQDSTSEEGSNRLSKRLSSRQNTLIEEEEFLPEPPALPPPEPLTERQKELLTETWKLLEEDIAKVGVITFVSLFETHPDVQQSFMPFKGVEIEDLKHSRQLRDHALRVMAFVQKAVARLYEPDKLETLLRDLGKKHYHYGAKQKYVDLVGPQFIIAIQPSLTDRWTEETQSAWTSLFLNMAYIMKGSMAAEERFKIKKPIG
ncbi:neuroglobin-1-like [Daktulosphaira vitifoliae]|uniref:neuroglobin-1-like n=1 Tax=Daktulosphaira vitifoliae TaxID=58002 RepID=UPI0021AA2EB2|nr:neuroglobin-1-like [Daktulosphaira vitifoliae]XP_050526147.1 neuroglobin-1-like [Daktulosphaira vitifoliae]XP_050526148.1 neuroglobin-1-like [Daktulosphaira vitifoliae]